MKELDLGFPKHGSLAPSSIACCEKRHRENDTPLRAGLPLLGIWQLFENEFSKIFAMFPVCKVNLSFLQLNSFVLLQKIQEVFFFPSSSFTTTKVVLDGFKFQIALPAETRVLHGKLCYLLWNSRAAFHV